MSHHQPFSGDQPQHWPAHPLRPQQEAASYLPLQPPIVASNLGQHNMTSTFKSAPSSNRAANSESWNAQINLMNQFFMGNGTTMPSASDHLFPGLSASPFTNPLSQPLRETGGVDFHQPTLHAPTASNARSSTMVENIARNLDEREDGELSDFDGIQANNSPRPFKRTRLSRSPQATPRAQTHQDQCGRTAYDSFTTIRSHDRPSQLTSPEARRVIEIPKSNVRDSNPSPANPSHANRSHSAQLTTSQSSAQDSLFSKKERSKRFLLAMYQNGYGYEVLVKEDLNPDMLRDLYQELGLPVSTKASEGDWPIQGVEAGKDADKNRSARRKHGQLSGESQTPVPSTNQSSVDIPRKVSAATLPTRQTWNEEANQAPTDRKTVFSQPNASYNVSQTREIPTQASNRLEYLARLNAAKTQKLPAPKGPDPLTSSLVGLPKPLKSPSGDALPQTQKDPLAREKTSTKDDAASKRQSELARLRAEALKSAKMAGPLRIEKEGSQEKDRHEQRNSSSLKLSPISQLPGSSSPKIAPIKQTKGVAPSKDDGEARSATSPSSPMFNLDDGPLPTPSFRIPGLFMDTLPVQTPPRQKEPTPLPSTRETLSKSHSDHLPSSTRPPSTTIQSPCAETLKQASHPSRKSTFGRSADEEINDECIIEASGDEDVKFQKSEKAKGQSDNRASPAVAPAKTGLLITPKEPHKLQAHERQLLEMRKQLELLEQRKKTKVVPSRSGTPQASSSSSKPHNVTNPLTSSATLEPKDAVEDLRNEVRKPLEPSPPQDLHTSLPPKPLLERPKTPGVSSLVEKANTLEGQPSTESKKAKIQSDIAQYDARFTNSVSQLQQLKAQMQELEMTMEKEREGKRRLVEELENMGISTEGIPDEALRETRDEAVAIKEAEAVNNRTENDSRLTEDPLSAPNGPDSANLSALKASSEYEAKNSSTRLDTTQGRNTFEDTHLRSSHESKSATSSPSLASIESTANKVATDVSEDKSEAMSVESCDVPEGAQAQEEHEAGPAESVSEDMDMDGFSGSEEGEIADEDDIGRSSKDINNMQEWMDRDYNEAQSDSKSLEAGEIEQPPSPKDDDNVATMKSDQETTAQMVSQGNLANGAASADEHQKGNDTSPNVNADDLEDSDSYEPPEGLTGLYQHQPSAADLDDEEYEPPEVAESVIAESQLPETSQPVVEKQVADSETGRNLIVHDTPQKANESMTDSDLEPLVKPSPSHPILLSGEAFTPYESPLKQFKDYRYHPDYSRYGFEGLRSLTYSHQIDPNREICRFEASGGTCNDPKCESQHFRSMRLKDASIILELGHTNPGRTEDEKAAYSEGLKNLLEQLKNQGVVAAEEIAPAVLSFRREYQSDPTRILNL